MMDTEDLQSELLALRRLYGLLINNERWQEDVGSGNLDKNSRRLLLNLLDTAAIKAFEAHAKVLSTQSRTTYSPWSISQGQYTDGLDLQSLTLRNAPTNSAYLSQQKADFMTGEGIFSESTNQVVSSGQSISISAGEPGFRLKRCRVCQKPKVKQLTREISTLASKALTTNDGCQNQNHKRSWEVQNDPDRVGGSTFSSNTPLAVDFFESLTLTNLTNQEDQISRDASTKILQIESCVSALQVAVKHANLFQNDYENDPSEIGNFSVGTSDPYSNESRTIWKPRDMAHRWHDQTARSINELTLQSPLVNTMLSDSETMSQQVHEPVVNEIEMFNRIKSPYDYMPEETYDPFGPFQSGGVSSNLNYEADKNRLLHRNLSSQINREQMEQLQMAKKEAMRTLELTQWLVSPVGYGRHSNEQEESEFTRLKEPGKTYKDQMEIYRGKHDLIDQEKRMVGYGRHNNEQEEAEFTRLKEPGKTNKDQMENYRGKHDLIDPEKRIVGYGRHNNEQQEFEFTRLKKPGKTYKDQMENYRGKHNLIDQEKKMVFPASQWHSDSPVSSSNYSSSRSTQSQSQSQSHSHSQSESQQVSTSSSDSEGSTLRHREVYLGSSRSRGHEQSESELSSVSSQDQILSTSSSNESSGSISKRAVSTKGHKKGDHKEPAKGYKKGDKKEPKRKRLGRLKKLKDKLAIIFHHHDHHHHGGDEDNHKKSLWKKAGKAVGHRRKKVEAYGGQAVNKIKKTGAVVVRKVGDKNQKRQLQALVGGFLKHSRHLKKSKKSKGDIKRLPSRLSGQHGGGKMGKKMQWWQMLRRQRKIKRLEKLRGKLDHGSKGAK